MSDPARTRPSVSPSLQAESALTQVDSGSTNYATATCPNGDRVLSGGFQAGAGEFHVIDSQISGQNAWFVRAEGGPPSGGSFYALAYCLD